MFQTHILKNNLRLLTIPVKEVPSVSVLVLLNAGSRNEDAKTNGLAHFTEHMVFQGNQKWKSKMEIGLAVDRIGAEYNGMTGKEYTGYYVKAESTHLELSLDLLSQMLWNSKFEESQIEREKGVIAEEIAYREDSPQISVSDGIMELVFCGHPLGLSGAGEKSTIKTFMRPDFLRFHKNYYHSSSAIVVVAGSFEEKKVVELVNSYFGNLPQGKEREMVIWKDGLVNPENKQKILIKEKTTDQTHFCLGMLSFPKTDKRRYSLAVLNAILGSGFSSRLFQTIREEKSLAYYVDSDIDSFRDTGIFTVSAGVNPQKLNEALNAVLWELKKLTEEKIKPEEVRKGKDYLRGKLALSLEESLDKAMFFGLSWLIEARIRTVGEILAEIEKVTAESIQEVAKDLFVKDHYCLAVVGKDVKQKEIEKII